MTNFFKNIFGTGDDNEGFIDYDEGYDTSSSAVTDEEADYGMYSAPAPFTSSSSSASASRAINIHSLPGQPKITIMKPSGYDEVMNDAIARLRDGTIIFLNLNGIDQEIGTRIVDFMTGAAAMCDGRIKKVDTCSYAIAPKNVEWVNNIED
ncbi:MAG: cell division protein SepF [Oscillospiraceae bacterium]|nr:cell division protein SepF [Oscillospiraceae bacterium]